MITLVSSQKLLPKNISAGSVPFSDGSDGIPFLCIIAIAKKMVVLVSFGMEPKVTTIFGFCIGFGQRF